jgi:uncharacterized protein
MNASMIRVPAMICLFSLLGFSGPATAQEARERPEGRERRQPTLTVTGEGEASARPDRAVVQLGAVAQAEHASAAQQQVNQPMESAIKLIRELGIPEESITTVGLMLSPVYSEARPPREHLQAQPRIVGYRASNRIRVEIDNLDRIGAVIDAGLQAGANHVEDLSFRLKDETAARSEALRLASKRARAKADAIAEAMSVRIVRVLEVSEGGVHIISPRMEFARGMMDAAVATPVQPGQVQVQGMVTVTYEISPPDGAGAGR